MSKVIVDGVNVAECKELQKVVNEKPYCDSSNTTKMTCKGNDCLFKQLQRAKAENEKLKNALIEIKVNFINQSARNGLSKFENEIFIKIDKVLSP